jgi:hypothetical protein
MSCQITNKTKRVIINLQQDVNPNILDWLNNQNNLSASIRILIARAINETGTKDIQEAIYSLFNKQ